MHSMFLRLLGVMLVASGVHPLEIDVTDDCTDFPSMFLGNINHTESLLGLMKSHFDASLEFLYGSKFYSTQYIERPGMAKLLMVESNRHWEDGMNVLKKYLNLGGTTYGDIFMNSMTFKGENNMYGDTSSTAKYKSSLKTVMQKSRRLGNTISDLYHSANHKPSSHGDADVAHFLQEKAEKESDVARKMVGHYMNLQKIDSFGIALDIFDKNL